MLAPDNVIFETKRLYHLFQRDESIFASSKSALNIKTFLYVSWKHLPHFCSRSNQHFCVYLSTNMPNYTSKKAGGVLPYLERQVFCFLVFFLLM